MKDSLKVRRCDRRRSLYGLSLPDSALRSVEHRLLQTVDNNFPSAKFDRRDCEQSRNHFDCEPQFYKAPRPASGNKFNEKKDFPYPKGWAKFETEPVASKEPKETPFNLESVERLNSSFDRRGYVQTQKHTDRKSQHSETRSGLFSDRNERDCSSKRIPKNGNHTKCDPFGCNCENLHQNYNSSQSSKVCKGTCGCSGLLSQLDRACNDVDCPVRKGCTEACVSKLRNRKLCERHDSLQRIIDSLTSILTKLGTSCNECNVGSSKFSCGVERVCCCTNHPKTPLSFGGRFAENSFIDFDVVDGQSCSVCNTGRKRERKHRSLCNTWSLLIKSFQWLLEPIIKDWCHRYSENVIALHVSKHNLKSPCHRVACAAPANDRGCLNRKCQQPLRSTTNRSQLDSSSSNDEVLEHSEPSTYGVYPSRGKKNNFDENDGCSYSKLESQAPSHEVSAKKSKTVAMKALLTSSDRDNGKTPPKKKIAAETSRKSCAKLGCASNGECQARTSRVELFTWALNSSLSPGV